MGNFTLGLDVGPNSIGWALINEKERRILNLGVRIFSEGVDNFDTKKEKSRNEDRRISRGMRRQIARRSRRKLRLRAALLGAGLFPADPAELESLLRLDPYALRAKAVNPEAKLTPHEIGRVFLHLNQRRGFLSNRKKDRGDSEVRGMLQEISELAQEIGNQTLGQFLNKKANSLVHFRRQENDNVRHRHTRRDMLEDEFERIWDTQAANHPTVLKESLRYGRLGKQKQPSAPRSKGPGESALAAFGIHGLIFFQRPMYWPKSVIGLCELEPKEKRCPRADRRAQRVRMLQEVNNLRFIDPESHTELRLSTEQRTMVVDYLATREKATFDQIRTRLGFLESVKFNLERGKRASLGGMTTDAMLAKAVGKEWHDRPDAEKNRIVQILLENQNDDDAVAERLVTEFGFAAQQADAALDLDYKAGYGALSRKALDKLLPHMERGLVYMDDDESNSALHAAGYFRRDQLQRRLFDSLPDPKRARNCPIGDIPNPVVKRALTELRKVVNAIVREYGKPAAIHVELARSVRMGKNARDEYSERIREREAERDAAAEAIRALPNVKVNRDSILRYLLWKEQKHECLYCGKPISQQQLYGGDVDVDHLLPYSRCLDDSQANKTVCHRRCNQEKRNETPYEWLAQRAPEKYARICQQAAALMRDGLMSYAKYKKFLQKELDLDKFIARQLVDTGYIARATAEYLRCLFEHPHTVLGLKGQHTADLRWQWGLNRVLRPDDEDVKNREDHRHHAIDALLVALTDRSRLQGLTKIRKSDGFDPQSGEVCQLPAPWDGFRDEVAELVNGICVSHRSERGVSGGLHKDMLYGPTGQPGVFVIRKPVSSLSPNEVPLIRDPEIRRIVETRLAEYGIEVGRGKKVDSKKMKQVLASEDNPLAMPSGVLIKKVRVLRKEETIEAIREKSGHGAYVKTGSNHHVCLFELDVGGETRIVAEFVSRLKAQGRLRDKQQIVQREHSEFPSAKFIMSLCVGDTVLAEISGNDTLMIVQTLVSTQERIHLVDARDARRSADQKDIGLTPTSLIQKYRTRKVTVDPLGRIRWAND